MSFPYPDIPITPEERRELRDFEELTQMMYELQVIGFKQTDGDLYFDKGKCPPYVTCWERTHQATPTSAAEYQYLTLTDYEGRFVEACLAVYSQLFNSRAKQRQTPLFSILLRNLEEIHFAVNQVYTPPQPAPKGK